MLQKLMKIKRENDEIMTLYLSQSISTVQIVLRLVAGREAEPLHHVADAERAVGGAEHVLDAVEPGLAGRGAGRPGGCARG